MFSQIFTISSIRIAQDVGARFPPGGGHSHGEKSKWRGELLLKISI